MAATWLYRLWHNRWLVLVGASWVETCTGLNVMYATFSPAIKSSLDYNQKQISRLGVAKDFGNAADIIAGFLSQFVSSRTLLFLGALQFLLGYGFLWLIVMDKIPAPPFWTVNFTSNSCLSCSEIVQIVIVEASQTGKFLLSRARNYAQISPLSIWKCCLDMRCMSEL